MNFKIFTLDEANRSIPDLTRLLKQMRCRREDLKVLLTELEGLRGQQAPLAPEPALDRRIDVKEAEVKGVRREMQDLLERIHEMGIVLRDLDQGLIDFPAIVDRQSGYLCWRLGEDCVGFWHGPEDGFAGRRPLERAKE